MVESLVTWPCTELVFDLSEVWNSTEEIIYRVDGVYVAHKTERN